MVDNHAASRYRSVEGVVELLAVLKNEVFSGDCGVHTVCHRCGTCRLHGIDVASGIEGGWGKPSHLNLLPGIDGGRRVAQIAVPGSGTEKVPASGSAVLAAGFGIVGVVEIGCPEIMAEFMAHHTDGRYSSRGAQHFWLHGIASNLHPIVGHACDGAGV